MQSPTPHAPSKRASVEAMLRAGDLRSGEIAARSGVPPSTVHRWKRRIVRRETAGAEPDPLDPSGWPVRRRAAVVRLLKEPAIDPRDVAGALGGRRGAVAGLRKALGLSGTNRASRAPAVPAVGNLDAALRAHIGRQIAALDARLNADEPGLDPGKALRDLGGLKRLLDELGGTRRTRKRDGEADGEPQKGFDAEPDADLAVLRERIARRVAAFAGDWPPQRIPGEPAALGPTHDRP